MTTACENCPFDLVRLQTFDGTFCTTRQDAEEIKAKIEAGNAKNTHEAQVDLCDNIHGIKS